MNISVAIVEDNNDIRPGAGTDHRDVKGLYGLFMREW